ERPLEAYIVAVADAFDAMTSTRSYRRALPMEVAFEELRNKSGSQFHPECVEALITAIEERGERHGLGHEEDAVEFAVAPPVAGALLVDVDLPMGGQVPLGSSPLIAVVTLVDGPHAALALAVVLSILLPFRATPAAGRRALVTATAAGGVAAIAATHGMGILT